MHYITYKHIKGLWSTFSKKKKNLPIPTENIWNSQISIQGLMRDNILFTNTYTHSN